VTHLLSFLFHDVYRVRPDESGFVGSAADRYKLSVTEFDRQLAGLLLVREDWPLLITRSIGSANCTSRFAVTVDDGGISYRTYVADRLEELGWRGHCFVTTGCIGRRGFLDRAQIRELFQRGHVIGSHSVSHPARFSTCSWNQMVGEWKDSRETLSDLLGEDVTVASVPGGYYSERVAIAASEAGFRALFTSEPETRMRMVNGCMVTGRFTVRNSCGPDFTARLALLRPSALLREWLSWNGKKVAKSVLGSAYPRVARAVAPARAVPSIVVTNSRKTDSL